MQIVLIECRDLVEYLAVVAFLAEEGRRLWGLHGVVWCVDVWDVCGWKVEEEEVGAEEDKESGAKEVRELKIATIMDVSEAKVSYTESAEFRRNLVSLLASLIVIDWSETSFYCDRPSLEEAWTPTARPVLPSCGLMVQQDPDTAVMMG